MSFLHNSKLFVAAFLVAQVNLAHAETSIDGLTAQGYEIKASAVLPDIADPSKPFHVLYLQNGSSVFLCVVRSNFVNSFKPEDYGRAFRCFEIAK